MIRRNLPLLVPLPADGSGSLRDVELESATDEGRAGDPRDDDDGTLRLGQNAIRTCSRIRPVHPVQHAVPPSARARRDTAHGTHAGRRWMGPRSGHVPGGGDGTFAGRLGLSAHPGRVLSRHRRPGARIESRASPRFRWALAALACAPHARRSRASEAVITTVPIRDRYARARVEMVAAVNADRERNGQSPVTSIRWPASLRRRTRRKWRRADG